MAILQVWRVADVPENDKFQFTYFAHKINSFETAPRKLLASDSRLRPDRYALEKGDLSKSGSEKNRFLLSLSLSLYTHTHTHTHIRIHIHIYLYAYVCVCLCGVQFIIGDMKIRTSECEGSIMACATYMMHGAFFGCCYQLFHLH